jgi:hypothetical protein
MLRTKLRFTAYCTLRLNRLRSNQSEAVWDRLRDSCNDAALNHADRSLYYANLRAVMTCLIRIAIARNCGVDWSITAQNFIGDYWKRRAKNIGALAEDYSKAFGSSHLDGVMSIVQLFSAKVTESKMSQQSQQRLYSEFHKFLGMMFEEFKDVTLAT